MLRVAVGPDHAGYPLKQSLVKVLDRLGRKVVDLLVLWLETPFEDGRHQRRINQIRDIEYNIENDV